MIVEWKEATGIRKSLLLSRIFREKHGLIRQLTAKAARAENTAAEADDLFQAGCIGFQRALEGFDPSRDLSIATYAAWWIKHEVQRVARRTPVVSLPRIRLTNEERNRAVLAMIDNPDVDPESIGVQRHQLEQVRNSIGVKFLSDDTPRGAGAIERKLLSESEPVDVEDRLDRAHAAALAEQLVDRVRAKRSREAIGCTQEQYAAALEVVRADDDEARRAAPERRVKRKRKIAESIERRFRSFLDECNR